ncbi:keratinocyte-associated protein 3 isoform X3 [Callorhinchus milii]|uniref:keratinocyte-associated protein 3 isoform X3 n=1 Tax=Callorhinchus milii TaxID=7868 RepID=UPI0004571FC6|nr:keratinocyte-associated protein 3 isoform X3 [Callorhinchus milii]|eukprot:gi/632971964/ref/XP_007902428.1/ PREDICTED: transmembrane protein 54 isoform X2 [Callorhinchus milii]
MCKIENLMDGKQLMKTGITLIVIGHLNFILGSIVHGTVLRHVTVPGDGILVEYSVTTIMSVISGIVSISTGIIVIVLSRDLSNTRLDTALAMWIPSLILSGVEVFLSIRCFLVALNLLGSVKRRRKNVRKLVRVNPLEDIQEVDEGNELLEPTAVRFWV